MINNTEDWRDNAMNNNSMGPLHRIICTPIITKQK